MSKKINIENYEEFFLDYLEGNLTSIQLEDLMVFLDSNPHLKEELEGFELVELQADEPIDSGLKQQLIREETTGLSRKDYLFISEIEGKINEEEKGELAVLIEQSPELIQELAIYHKTILPHEEKVSFEGKSALIKKEAKVIAWWRYAATAAAAILILLLLNININNELYSPKEFSWKEGIESIDDAEINYAAIEVKEEEQEEKNQETPIIKLDPAKPAVSYADNNNESIPQKKEETKEVSPEEIKTANDKIVLDVKEEEQLAHTPAKETRDELVEKNAIAQAIANKKEDFVPIEEYAKEKLLKGKTFSETVMDELADLSNDKIRLETKKNKEGTTEKFALNIGKLSISRNR